MINGNIKIACLEAKIKALELAKQNKRIYLLQNKDIPESEYDHMPNYDYMSKHKQSKGLFMRLKKRC